MRTLIAVTGPHNIRTRQVVKTLVDSLELIHVNMRKPIVDFTAECMNLEPHFLDHHIPLHQFNADLQMTVYEIQRTIQKFLCSTNKEYLIDRAQTQMAKDEFLLGLGSKGFIISNITEEAEAAWIRNSGGLLVHVEDRSSLGSPTPIAVHENDEVIVTCRDAPPTAENLKEFIKNLTNRFNLHASKKVA